MNTVYHCPLGIRAEGISVKHFGILTIFLWNYNMELFVVVKYEILIPLPHTQIYKMMHLEFYLSVFFWYLKKKTTKTPPLLDYPISCWIWKERKILKVRQRTHLGQPSEVYWEAGASFLLNTCCTGSGCMELCMSCACHHPLMWCF